MDKKESTVRVEPEQKEMLKRIQKKLRFNSMAHTLRIIIEDRAMAEGVVKDGDR